MGIKRRLRRIGDNLDTDDTIPLVYWEQENGKYKRGDKEYTEDDIQEKDIVVIWKDVDN